jgi:hypothetical protein
MELARGDERVVAGAAIGSLAAGPGDRWSDVDLGFGVVGAEPADVLRDWTPVLERELGAVVLFDLPSRSSLYRVFLLPGSLQVDISVTPATEFRPLGPNFRLLFGRAGAPVETEPPAARELFGWAAHHAVRTWVCMERGRVWQAHYWLGELRDKAIALACLRRGLDTDYGRGVDRLPPDVLTALTATLAGSVDPDELLRALGAAVECLLEEAGEARPLAARLEPELRRLTPARTRGSS